jgi:hypothetical protein
LIGKKFKNKPETYSSWAPGNHFEAAPAYDDLVEVIATIYKKPQRPLRTYSVSVPAYGHFLEAEAVFEAAAASRGIWRS